jgi:DNA repair exonuclease SbcCD ATPase subunit
MADGDDLKEIERRLAAVEKELAALPGVIEKTFAEIRDNYQMLDAALDKLNAHIEVHEKDQEKTSKDFGETYDMMQKMITVLGKNIDDNESKATKGLSDLQGRVKEVEGKVAKMGKR